jgi:hypothetical protein
VNLPAHPLCSIIGPDDSGMRAYEGKRRLGPLPEGNVLEAEGRGIDRLALDLAALQESVQCRFLDQDFSPLPLNTHAVMREQVILAPTVNQAG